MNTDGLQGLKKIWNPKEGLYGQCLQLDLRNKMQKKI